MSAVDTRPCPGCHGGDFADFDHYCNVNNIAMEDTPIAFAAWLNLKAGWDGDAELIPPSTRSGGDDEAR